MATTTTHHIWPKVWSVHCTQIVLVIIVSFTLACDKFDTSVSKNKFLILLRQQQLADITSLAPQCLFQLSVYLTQVFVSPQCLHIQGARQLCVQLQMVQQYSAAVEHMGFAQACPS